MPPPLIINPDELNWDRPLYTREQIYAVLPQQHEFSQLDAIICLDKESVTAAAYRDVREDEWWCRGHMPGSPIFPGVLMVESAAQLAAFMQNIIIPFDRGFMGFGGIDQVKFRSSVVPPCRILIVGHGVDYRPRRFIYDTQAFVNGTMVFEGRITGMKITL
ncbi:MAG: beta-hydroxyacyl-ACP dehydratase [Planctomycetota bacterium]